MNRDSLALFPMCAARDVPAVTTEQMREVDRLATEDAQLALLQMMENAGRALAQVVRDYAPVPLAEDEPRPAESKILVVAGKGNNGGGALAAARHLRNWGLNPEVVLNAAPGSLNAAAAHQHHILHKDGMRPIWPGGAEFDERFPELLESASVVVDGLVGYGLRGALQGDSALLVDAILDRAPPAVISLDVPSGFDATTGDVYSTAIVATATLTLALPKTGLLQGDATAAVGDLLLADIGVPHYIYARLDVSVPPDLFAPGPILRLLAEG
ncbi:MAG: NAD(P)H-hydrate epimerase [Dehalococcoidia bacterium]